MRLSYSPVVSTLALVVALGTGGAYAASQLPKHSVGSKQLKKGAVTSKAVKDGSLTVADLAGVPMGGDLTGTFPNATVRGYAKGSRVTARVALPAGGPVADVLQVPGFGKVSAACTSTGGLTGLNLYLLNASATAVDVVLTQNSQSPADTTTKTASLNPGVGVLAVEFAGSATSSSARTVHLAAVQGPDLTLDAVAQTGVGSGCRVQVAASSS